MAKTYLLIWAITALVVVMIHGVSSSSNDDAKQVLNRKAKAFNDNNNNKMPTMVMAVVVKDDDESVGEALQDALAGLQNMTNVAQGLLNDPEMGTCAEDVAALATLVIDAVARLRTGSGLYVLFEDIISLLRTKNAVKNDCQKFLEDPNDPNAVALLDEYHKIKKVIHALMDQFHLSLQNSLN